MKNYVTFSMGICSAYIAARLAETCQNPVCVWSDTGGEDEDTYRFGRDVVKHWNLELIEASSGISLFDFFVREKMIPARQIPACSIALKIKPSQKFFETCEPGIVAYGYDVNEEERSERTLDRWKFSHLKPWFPLQEWGVTKQECFGFFADRGIPAPRMYRHFRHANCLPCKNFRVPDWQALRYYYPTRFVECLKFENTSGLKWMQDGPYLRDLPEWTPPKRRRGSLGYHEPVFNFDMGCDACSRD